MGCCHTVIQFQYHFKFGPEGQFTLGRELGSGQFAKVYACTENKTGKIFAVKVLPLNTLVSTSSMRMEVEILKKVGQHPNVLQVHEFCEDSEALYIVSDLCSGGDLWARIVKEGISSEKRAAEIMNQLAQAVQHIHKCGISHRDLKPENILLTSDSPDATIQIADFGVSKLIGKSNMMKTVCGTRPYCAPEVIRGKSYTSNVDNWSIGILMYILLCGYHPFDMYGDLSDMQMNRKIIQCDFDFDDEVWTSVSDEAKWIIKGLLKFDAIERMSIKDLLATNWIQGKNVSEEMRPDVVENMKNYQGTNFHTAGVVCIAKLRFKKGLEKAVARRSISSPAAGMRFKPSSSASLSLGDLKLEMTQKA
uniref:Calcium/calmodulin-dependent protein kinase type IV-like n=1 Tax=Hirondellea gigas TaxID=1518452 RepID=A0A6A7GC87_9CRUS